MQNISSTESQDLAFCLDLIAKRQHKNNAYYHEQNETCTLGKKMFKAAKNRRNVEANKIKL